MALGIMKNNPANVKSIPKNTGFREIENNPLVLSSVLAEWSIPTRHELLICTCAMIIHNKAR